MATFLIFLQLAVVLAMIFIGAKIGGIGLGIYGMVGVFILVFVFGLEPGAIPIDVMLIIVCVITASAALQAAGGLDYMVNVAARFLRKHPGHITFYAPLVTWLFSLWAGTAHTSYALLPIISEIARKDKVRPERPLSVATIAASLGCTGSPVSAATAAILSEALLGDFPVGGFHHDLCEHRRGLSVNDAPVLNKNSWGEFHGFANPSSLIQAVTLLCMRCLKAVLKVL